MALTPAQLAMLLEGIEMALRARCAQARAAANVATSDGRIITVGVQRRIPPRESSGINSAHAGRDLIAAGRPRGTSRRACWPK